MKKPLLSIVSPVYQAEKIVDELVKRIAEEVTKITTNFEIILVEDGSPDNSWEKIAENCAKYPFVKGIKLSRNFGQHYAITAALHHAQGEYVVLMDCDLQDNPKYIADLYAKAQEGYDIVYTKKEQRKHSFFKNVTAKIFFTVFNYLSDNQKADDKTGAYSLLSRKVVDAFCLIQDYHRHYLNIIRFLGFSSTYIQIIHEERYEGRSSYNLSKLINHALNGITSQSDKLLRLSITVGFSFFIFAILWAFYLLIGFFIHGALAGYTSLMVALLLSTGIILMSIGVLGIYIGKIFEQVKSRPLYLVDKKINYSSNEMA
jgi:glycosyltransferase involved in cell wall biosynthesis